MSVDRATVLNIASLARIQVPEGEVDKLAGELNNILGWVEQLDAIDTDGVEPMASVIDVERQPRADEVNDGGIQDKILGNATDARDGYFTVPKVLE